MLTSKRDINYKLLYLQLKAKDYITKSFKSTELLLIIKVISKRLAINENDSKDFIELGKLKILVNERTFLIDSDYIDLSFKEFEVLKCLCKNKCMLFSRDDLLNKVCIYDFEVTTLAIYILIQRLRKKLKLYQHYIKTLYKTSYKLDVKNYINS